jgi:hypothetical protein
VAAEAAPVLAELTGTVFDAATFAAYRADLVAHATVFDVQRKGAPGANATDAPPDAESALAALAAGQLVGVQVRYQFRGESWWDTLLRAPNGIRLVRCRAQA